MECGVSRKGKQELTGCAVWLLVIMGTKCGPNGRGREKTGVGGTEHQRVFRELCNQAGGRGSPAGPLFPEEA